MAGAVPAQVSEFTATGKYEDFTTAIRALDGALGLAIPGTSRILVIVSDGKYKGTQHADGQKLLTRLAASGCRVPGASMPGPPWPTSATPRASVPWPGDQACRPASFRRGRSS